MSVLGQSAARKRGGRGRPPVPHSCRHPRLCGDDGVGTRIDQPFACPYRALRDRPADPCRIARSARCAGCGPQCRAGGAAGCGQDHRGRACLARSALVHRPCHPALAAPDRGARGGRADRRIGGRGGRRHGSAMRPGSTAASRRRRGCTVVTQGIFVSMVQSDPELAGISGVLFDEVHERSLDGDFGLALALDAQAALRPDLRLLAMSATLAGERFSALMGGAPLIESEGRSYPIAIAISAAAAEADRGRHGRRHPPRARRGPTAACSLSCPASPRSSAPPSGSRGCRPMSCCTACTARSIRRPARRDPRRGAGPAQDRARHRDRRDQPDDRRRHPPWSIRVSPAARATIAPPASPGSSTERVSQAAATQRAGRAGRQAPGVAYRLWEAAATAGLPLRSARNTPRPICRRWCWPARSGA
jgi:hypothetical protein